MICRRLAAGAVALFASTALYAQAAPLADDAKLFGARQSVSNVAISPSGSKVLMLAAGPGRTTAVQVYDLNGGPMTTPIMSRGDPESIQWCEFATDDRLVCRYSGNVPVEGVLVGFARTVSVKTDGTELKMLGQNQSFYDDGIRQDDGYVLDWLPDDGGSILMARVYIPEAGRTGSNISRTKNGLGVDKISLSTLKSSIVEQPDRLASGFMTDGRGNLRIRIQDETSDGATLTGKTNYSYRKPGSRSWQTLGSWDPKDGDASIYPLAVEGDTNSLLLLKKLDGRDALYRMALDGTNGLTLVAKNAQVDIDGVSRFGRGQRVISYDYVDDRARTVYFDKEFDALATRLGRALPNAGAINFSSASTDGQKLVIFAGSDVSPGTYYYFDRKTAEMSELAKVRPALANRTLAAVKSVTYKSRDGASIPAYITMPTGASGKNMPAVVLPHGGPSSRDEWGFDWLPQFLAARGYVVIQPNYRGSSGYGDDFQNENGFRNWQTAIADIIDSADYLVGQGIADKNRLAIVGWSYGGYAALQSAAVDPTKFKSVVAIAPVTDLALMKQQADNYTNSKLVQDFIGKGDHITAGSPLRNAKAIKVPVMLAHGDLDTNVEVDHSDRMAKALTEGGIKVDYLRYKGLDHQLEDSNARIEVLTHMGQLLEQTIGK